MSGDEGSEAVDTMAISHPGKYHCSPARGRSRLILPERAVLPFFPLSQTLAV